MSEKLREAAQQAVEAIRGLLTFNTSAKEYAAGRAASAALRAALAEPEPVQEPVAKCINSDSWNCKYCRKTESCDALKDPGNFAAPPQRSPLTDDEISVLFSEAVKIDKSVHWLCRAIERRVRGEKE
jgi:hypothetical protein